MPDRGLYGDRVHPRLLKCHFIQQEDSAMERRVPVCGINWCCPYRSDLCQDQCSGQRKPKSYGLVVSGDDAFVREGDTGPMVRYSIPEETKTLLRGFDQGRRAEVLAGRYKFEPAKPKSIQ
jgi:hypothetical protein